MERFREIQKEIETEASDILQSSNFRKMKEYLQHGNVTVNTHVMTVARCSVAITDVLHIP